MNWAFKSFQQLSNAELYQLLKLRVDVFVVEQACAYPELDNADQEAIHLLATENNQLTAYARIVNEKGHWHIGRIVVHAQHRGKGLAKQIMQKAETYCWHTLQVKEIHLSAQTYLEAFYKTQGYTTYSQPYNWDGIMHVDMKKTAS